MEIFIDEKRSFCQSLKEIHPNLWILRDDLIHPEVSGNKWRKLKYFIEEAQKSKQGILTFGGAFSNHIAATAAASKLFNLPCIGIIRGEKAYQFNKTLTKAQENGMILEFVSRSFYADREKMYLYYQEKYPNYLVIPEGGSGFLGEKGASEIVKNLAFQPDYFVLAVGTGTTLRGILHQIKEDQKVVGIPILAKSYQARLLKEIEQKEPFFNPKKLLWCEDYHFGGYAKYSPSLLAFQQEILQKYEIPLDHVYTAKMFYATLDLISKHFFEEKKEILMIHTGGLQGNF